MLAKRTLMLFSLLALLVLPGRAVLAATSAAEPIDLDNLTYRGVVPGESSLNQTVTALGEPTEQRIRHLLVYRESSTYVELMMQKNAVAGIYLLLAPSPDILGSPSRYGLAGNTDLAASLGKLYSFKRVSAIPGVRTTTPSGWVILELSRHGRTASFAYDAVKHTLLQVSISKE